MNIKTIIETFKRKYFPTQDDSVWKRWVDFKQRETNDLYKLLASDVRDSLKKRALFLLIVPSADFNPIYWTQKVGKFYHKTDFFTPLSPELLTYATDLIIEFSKTLRPMHNEKPKQYAEGGGGITIFHSVPGKYHDALYFYNECILHLLTIVPEEKCEQIFPLYSLQDISTYWNMDDCSGYNPFQSLLYSSVDEKWKRNADTKMRQIIKDELAGKIEPREDWEDALKCYARIINFMLYCKEPKYSDDMFADQIAFIVSKEHYAKKLIDSWNVAMILNKLSAGVYKNIRYKVAQFMLLSSEDVFSIWSESSLAGAYSMLAELGDGDEELIQKIQLEIDKYHKNSEEAAQKANAVQKEEEGILHLMK